MAGLMEVAELGIVPVKGTRYLPVEAVELAGHGARGDRAFLVVSATDCGLLVTGRTPALLAVRSGWDVERRELRLAFPDGSVVTERPVPGAAAVTGMYDGRPVSGRLVDGALAAALSAYLGRPVRLLAPDPGTQGADDAPVTLMSEASLERVADEVGVASLDPRRFRMTMTVRGPSAWQEESWLGRELAVGDAVLRVGHPVVRCVVTTRDPDAGSVDARVLHALARLRGPKDLCFGVWCEVVRPGTVRLGDRAATV